MLDGFFVELGCRVSHMRKHEHRLGGVGQGGGKSKGWFWCPLSQVGAIL